MCACVRVRVCVYVCTCLCVCVCVLQREGRRICGAPPRVRCVGVFPCLWVCASVRLRVLQRWTERMHEEFDGHVHV